VVRSPPLMTSLTKKSYPPSKKFFFEYRPRRHACRVFWRFNLVRNPYRSGDIKHKITCI